MDQPDRDAILARRALLISAALAGLSCTTPEPTTGPEPTTPPAPESTQAPAPSVEAPPTVVEEPGPSPDQDPPGNGSRLVWAEVMAAAPPIDMPEGLTHNERKRLTGLADHARNRYAKLEQVWTALPECWPSQSDCEGWADAVAVIADVADDGYGSPCGYSSRTTHTIIQRERALNRYIGGLARTLLEDLDTTIAARDSPGEDAAWAEQRVRLQSRARPCLSCMEPTAAPIISAIAFADGEAKLSSSDEVEYAYAINLRNQYYGKTYLVVRGHADPSEPNPEALALQRAEAVVAALVDLGINHLRVEARGYGANLRLTNDPVEAAQNRRVDFEVLAP